jgi:hypothetical protein
MRVDKITYYLINSPNGWLTGVLLPSQEIATKFEVEPYNDYQTYVKRCEALGVEPAEEVKPIINNEPISPAQGRTQLSRMGLLQTAAEAVAQIGGELEIFWEYATQWDKNSQAVQSLAQQFDIDLDDFFDKARKITV